MNECIAAPRPRSATRRRRSSRSACRSTRSARSSGPRARSSTRSSRRPAPTSTSTTTASQGIVTIGSVDGFRVEEAKARILSIIDPPKADVGGVYKGRVVNITKFGAFVNILPGRDGLRAHLQARSRQAHQRRRGRAQPRRRDRGPRRRDRRQGQGQPVARPAIRRRPTVKATARRRAHRRGDRGGDAAAAARVDGGNGVDGDASPSASRTRSTTSCASEFGDLGPAGEPAAPIARRAIVTAAPRSRPLTPSVADRGNVAAVGTAVAPDRSTVESRASRTAHCRPAHHPTVQRADGRHRAHPVALSTSAARGSASALATNRRELSGVSHFLEHLLFKGTDDRGRARDQPDDRPRRRRHQRLHRQGVHGVLLPPAGAPSGARHRPPRRRADHTGAARRRRRQRAPGHPGRAGDGRRQSRRRRPPRVHAPPVPRAPARPRDCRRAPSTVAGDHARRRPRLLRRRTTAPVPPWLRSPVTLDHDEALEQVEAAFAGVRRPATAASPHRRRAGRRRGEIIEDDTEQVHLVLGMQALSRTTIPTVRRSTSSTTSSAVACRAGCSTRSASGAASPTASTAACPRTPMPARFTIYAGTQPEHADEVLELIHEQLELLIKDGITDDELDDRQGLPHRRVRAGSGGHGGRAWPAPPDC